MTTVGTFCKVTGGSLTLIEKGISSDKPGIDEQDKLTYKTFHMFGTFGKMALPLKYLHSHNYGEYVRL
jgi:hypothetical protein